MARSSSESSSAGGRASWTSSHASAWGAMKAAAIAPAGPSWSMWAVITGSAISRSWASFSVTFITHLLGSSARCNVAAGITGEDHGDGHFVTAQDCPAELGPPVDDPGERRHQVVEFVLGEAPVLGNVGVAHHVGGPAADRAQQAPHDRWVDLGRLLDVVEEVVERLLAGGGLDLADDGRLDPEISYRHERAAFPGRRGPSRRGARTASPASAPGAAAGEGPWCSWPASARRCGAELAG